MTSPVVSARNQTNSGNATNHPAALATHVTGELLVQVFAFDGGPTISINSGTSSANWTLETPDVHSTGTPTLCIVWKVAESASETLNLTSSASEASANMGWAIDAGTTPSLEIIYGESSSANPDPPALTPAAGSQDYLWLTGFGRDNQGTASAGPSSWDQFRVEAGVSSGGASMAVAELTSTGTTANPGAFTIGVETTVTFTMSVHDAASGSATGLTTQGAAHAHAADNITLSTDSSVSLTVQDSAHAHAAESVALTTDTTLAVQNATHAHAADNVPSGSLIEITGLDFTYTTAGSGNNYSLKQALSPSRIHCTLLWYEKRQTQTVYSGGVMFSNDSGLFDGGQDVAMFVTHGCPGTYNTTTGQRTSGDTSVMHHEIAGMSSASQSVSGRDYIASRSALVQGSETQQSFEAVYDEWVPRVARITTSGTDVTHENYVDWRDPLLVIRQRILTTDIDDLSGSRVWIGAPPWITNGAENFRAKFFMIKQFSRPLTDSEIDAEFANFTDTPIASDCWFSNVFPELTAGVVPDLKGFGTAHDFALYDGDTPSSFTEDFEPQFFDESVSLTVDAGAHAHAADNVVLTTSTTLAVDNATHAHAVDSPTMSTASTLTVADAAHGHEAGAVVLTTEWALTVADAAHAHAVENVTLGTESAVDLVVADARHAHDAQSTALTLDTTLAVDNTAHGHAAGNVTLSTTGEVNLTVADAQHAHAVDGVALSTSIFLAVQDAQHGHEVDSVGLSQAVALTVADASHGHAADAAVLTVTPGLLVNDATHAHASDGVALTLDAWLAVADAWHVHTAQSPTLQLVGVEYEIEEAFTARPEPRNWTARPTPRNWSASR